MNAFDKLQCWICGNPADSGEHKFKARDLKKIFDRDGFHPENLPFHFFDGGHRRIRSPKSDAIKYPKIICRNCNNNLTSPFDRAYDRFSDWCSSHQSHQGVNEINLEEVFGKDCIKGVENLRRYGAKTLGCRIIASNSLLPDNFPNPVYGNDFTPLLISICRMELFRFVPNYISRYFEQTLGKSPLLANISKSHLEKTGIAKVQNAVWWESIGHFHIIYWLNIDINPVFGNSLNISEKLYNLINNDFDKHGAEEVMKRWIGERAKDIF